jgi:type I restriction enzyme S subunit
VEMEVKEVDAKYLIEQSRGISRKVGFGYKRTELGLIPTDWDVIQLGMFARFKTGPFGSALHKSDYVDGGIPVINPMQIVDGAIVPTESMAISERAAFNLSDFRLVAGDIVIGRRGEMGRCAVVTSAEDGWLCGTGSMIVKVGSKLDASYVRRLLSSRTVISAIENASVGTTMVNLNQGTLGNLSLAIPSSRKEQTAIANTLSDVDALINNLENLIAKKQAIKTTTMQQLLTGHTRLPQFATHPDGRPKGIKQSELGEIPEDWEVIALGDIAKIQRGASPRPIDSPVWFDETSPTGWLRISDVTRTSKYLWDTTQNLSPAGITNSRFVANGSLVMSICATVGKPILTKKDLCIHDGFVVFGSSTADLEFLYYVLQKLEPEWAKHGQTGSQMNLNTSLINNSHVALPLINEQSAIAKVLSDIDVDLESLTDRLEKVRQIKQGMMQELLTGRTRLVKPAEAG